MFDEDHVFNPQTMLKKMEAMRDAMKMASKASEAVYTGSAERLKELGAAYLTPNDLAVGDLVTWKSGLKNVKWPREGNPAVLLEVRPGRRVGLEKESSGTPREDSPEEARIGVLDSDGEFSGYWVDLSRLQKYKGEENES